MAKSYPPPDYGTFIRINDLNVHVWSVGTGPPVILIHGFMGMAYDWRANVEQLGKHFHVYAPDLPGFGFSDKPLDFGYTSNRYAEFVVSFLDKYKLKRAVLVGNSMGGQISLETCLRYPERVAGLVLVDSGGYPQSVEFLPFKLLGIPIIDRMAMALVNRTVINIMLRKGIYFNSSFVTEEVVKNYNSVYGTAEARKIPPVVIRKMVKDEAYIASNLHNVEPPTLIIWGAGDRVISPRRAEMFRRDIKGASLLTVPEAGHMPQVERAEIVNKAIIDFSYWCWSTW